MDKPSTQKRPKLPPRRNMEARREQNRIASRNYREKRRQKLALLNQLLEPESSSADAVASSAAAAAAEASSSDLDASAFVQGDAGLVQPPSLSLSHAPVSQPPISQHEPVLDMDGLFSGLDNFAAPPIDMHSSSQYLMPAAFSTHYPVPAAATTTTTPSYASEHALGALLDPMFGPSSVTTDAFAAKGDRGWQAVPDLNLDDAHPPPPTNKTEALQDVLQGLGNLSITQKRVLISLLQTQIQNDTDPLFPCSQKPLLPSSTSNTNTDNNSNSNSNSNNNNPTRTRMQLEALQFAVSLYQTATICRSPSDARMDAGLFNALFANCYALGMPDVGPMLCEDGWSIFSLGPDTAYHPSQLSVVRARFRNLAPALRPCDMQLTVAHHPYIDVIPYPSFRSKILQALDRDQPLLDEDVLCNDLLTGLTCWGAQHNPQGMGAAVPWDLRSWEPSLWFLEKYRDYVGGWDDDMWRGARTWRGMRGERVQELDTPSP